MADEKQLRILKDRLSEEGFFIALKEMIEEDIRGNNSLEKSKCDPTHHVYCHGATQGLRVLLNRLTALHEQAQEEIANGQV